MTVLDIWALGFELDPFGKGLSDGAVHRRHFDLRDGEIAISQQLAPAR
jgi:hypothetical protein